MTNLEYLQSNIRAEYLRFFREDPYIVQRLESSYSSYVEGKEIHRYVATIIVGRFNWNDTKKKADFWAREHTCWNLGERNNFIKKDIQTKLKEFKI